MWLSAPRMYINQVEVNSTELIDNNNDTCVQLPGSDGCNMDKVTSYHLLVFRLKDLT